MRDLLSDIEYELQQIRKFIYVATCALTCEERNYVAGEVADPLDQVVAVRVSNLLEELANRNQVQVPPGSEQHGRSH